MVFSSLPFLFLFLPLVLLCYFLLPSKCKNYCLLIFSLIFYAWGEPIYILLMIFSALVDYFNTRLMVKKTKYKKFFLLSSIVINLGLLTFFKYSDFLIQNINYIFDFNLPLLNLPLPIGISFYTFQTLSYTIDVYRGDVLPEKNFFNYLTYICMFFQLIAGPIVRYKTIAQQLTERQVNLDNFSAGMMRFLRGLFKKILIANNVGYLFSLIINSSINEISVLTIWLLAISFSLQVYFDFSGYSDMAIGLGKIFGFDFLENFDYPFISKSITEFWRRWHISLSSWFKDYVYIPLGGSRVSKIINVRNILIVWVLTGIWHGASWNYVIWGIFWAVILILEKFVWGRFLSKLPNFMRHLYTLFLIILSFLIFGIEDINLLIQYFKGAFGFLNIPFVNKKFIFYILNYGIIILIAILFSMPIGKIVNDKFTKYNSFNIFICIIRGIAYVILFIISISYLLSDTYNPFLYFRF